MDVLAPLCIEMNMALARKIASRAFQNVSGWPKVAERIEREPIAQVMPRIVDFMDRHVNDAHVLGGERWAKAQVWIVALAEAEGVPICAMSRPAPEGDDP